MFYIISLLALFIVQCKKIKTNETNPTSLQSLKIIQDMMQSECYNGWVNQIA